MWLATPECTNGPQENQSPGRQKDPLDVSEIRCGHFSIQTGHVRLPGAIQPLRVPIYRCAMAEEMVTRLQTKKKGKRLADLIQAEPLEGRQRLLCGPDLEAITAVTCTTDRCRRSCEP